MFSAFRERMGERLKALGPKDEADKAIAALIDKGTNEELLGPDWQSSFELVDLVNSQPQIMCEKLLRTVNRTIARPNTKVQLLALSMLDTCVRNCHPLLHTTLANSLIWSDMVKLVQDTSVSRIDDEVRDKILAMIEDYARSLGHLPTFKDTYESLVVRGHAGHLYYIEFRRLVGMTNGCWLMQKLHCCASAGVNS
ncbi:hypothetical protein DUNSADRAFT_17980 [Dunaliella salina]|uniref:VHS domain-containing protein n=1 Tax=Dunaliella salina TaxID=3046 RepID=A0ABQ7GZM2_DUNSA|nr:hypothetical protein DUNSADRAFT_17980 [Dunaliella salina]|eukprot:KAF5840063.1 hypothetical protein DUNSADRAFT_17980 [Dunaliella salina]